MILSEDGYGTVIGRIKDIIIRGGENIFPSEIEQFIVKHPQVMGIQVRLSLVTVKDLIVNHSRGVSLLSI